MGQSQWCDRAQMRVFYCGFTFIGGKSAAGTKQGQFPPQTVRAQIYTKFCTITQNFFRRFDGLKRGARGEDCVSNLRFLRCPFLDEFLGIALKRIASFNDANALLYVRGGSHFD